MRSNSALLADALGLQLRCAHRAAHTATFMDVGHIEFLLCVFMGANAPVQRRRRSAVRCNRLLDGGSESLILRVAFASGGIADIGNR